MSKRIAIVGATLPGCVAAYHLSKLGYEVDLFDSLDSLDSPISSSLGDKFALEDHLFFIPLSSSYIEGFLKNAGLMHNTTIANIMPKDIDIYRDGLRSSSFYIILSGKIYLSAYFIIHRILGLFTRSNRYRNKTISKYFEDCYGSRFSSNIAMPLIEAIYGGTPSYLKISRAFAHTQTTNRVQFLNVFRLSKSWLRNSKPLIQVAFYKGGKGGLARDILASAGVNVLNSHTVEGISLSKDGADGGKPSYDDGGKPPYDDGDKPSYTVTTSRGVYSGFCSVVVTTDANATGNMLEGFRSDRFHKLTSALQRTPYAKESTLYLLYNTNEHLNFAILLTPFYERGLISSIINLSKIIGDNKPYTLLRVNVNSMINDGSNLWDEIIHEFYDTMSRKMVPIEIIQHDYRACTLHTSVDYDHTDELIRNFESDNKGLILLGDYEVDYPHNSMMKIIAQKILNFHYR